MYSYIKMHACTLACMRKHSRSRKPFLEQDNIDFVVALEQKVDWKRELSAQKLLLFKSTRIMSLNFHVTLTSQVCAHEMCAVYSSDFVFMSSCMYLIIWQICV